MLSDEEKQSIESLKNIAIYIGDNYTFSQQGIRNLRENLRIVLPVIEKQAKEIEELKEKNKNLNWYFKNQKDNFVHKDKIKAKIEELEIEQESNREDLKIAIDNLLFQNIDKIGNRISINMSVREILQSLLEKE